MPFIKLKKRLLPNSSIYAVIDRQSSGERRVVKIAKDCIAAGVKILQLRDKTEDVAGFYRQALLLKKIISKKGLLIINDRLDIACLVGADGLHVGQDDLSISSARRLLPDAAIIGKSCHSLTQALRAQKEGADYVSIGPIFRTPTKPAYTPVGMRLLKSALAKLKIPIVAIGGIDKNNIRLVKEAGAKYIALVRAICQEKNVGKAVKELENQLA